MIEGVFLHLFGLESWALQVSTLLVVFVALNRTLGTACLTLLLWLLPMEWAASSRFGFCSLALVCVFFLARIFRSRLEQQWGIMHVVLTILGALIHQLLVAMLVLITQPGSSLLKAIVLTLPQTIIVAALFAWPLGYLCLKLDRKFYSKHGDMDVLRGAGLS